MITGTYPLTWPVGVKRTDKYSRGAGPNQMPSGKIRQQLQRELDMLGITDAVISTNVAMRRDGLPYANQAQPDDPGVVLYFTRNGQEIAMACDRWHTVDANLRAIGLNIEAIRGMERWGVNDAIDRAFRGYTALPEHAIVTPYMAKAWHEVLHVTSDAPWDVVRAAYRQALLNTHPDRGGTPEALQEVRDAYEQAYRQYHA